MSDINLNMQFIYCVCVQYQCNWIAKTLKTKKLLPILLYTEYALGSIILSLISIWNSFFYAIFSLFQNVRLKCNSKLNCTDSGNFFEWFLLHIKSIESSLLFFFNGKRHDRHMANAFGNGVEFFQLDSNAIYVEWTEVRIYLKGDLRCR